MKHVVVSPVRERLNVDECGHVFRGAFIDNCCEVERWAASILTAAQTKVSHRAPLGPKLREIRRLAERDLAENAGKLFKYPKAVLSLLDRFRPYADLRSQLSHSVQTVAFGADGEMIFFYQLLHGGTPSLAVAVTRKQQCQLLSDVKMLAKLFNDQRTRI